MSKPMLQPPRRRGRPPRYPWATWFDGESHLLLPGKEFPANFTAEQFRAQIYAKARRLGLSVRAGKYGDGLVVQCMKARGGEETRQGRPPAYNWDEILDGNVRVLRARFDFTGKPKNFAATVRNAARRRGLRASVNITGNEVHVIALPRHFGHVEPERIAVPDEPLECREEQVDLEDWKAQVAELVALLEDSNVLESLSSSPVSGETPETMTQEVDSGTVRADASAERGAQAHE